MKQRVKQWLSKLTLAQKARLVSGADWWRLVSYEKMGIPSIMVSDGPHGLRT
jgi:beta-glucosidase